MAVFADPHYCSKRLNPEGAAFERALAGDRKLLHLSTEILEETVNQIAVSGCDLVIVPGDLTKDGERIGHEELSVYLQKFVDAGKKVYIICGNHDINSPAAVEFLGDRTKAVPSVSPLEFVEIYSEMGYNSAVKRDINSLSYVAEPSSWLRIIAMDSCYYSANYDMDKPFTGGFFNEDTFNWIVEQIKEGREKGQIVIGFMHHGVVPHLGIQEKFFSDYLVEDWNKVAATFADKGMHVVLTGHFHAQDISEYITNSGNKIWDVQTGSLVTYPVPYREMTINKNGRTEIKSIIITEIDAVEDFGTYSEEFLYNGLLSLIPYMLKKEIVKYGISAAFADAYVTSLLNQKAGDFDLTELAASVITDFYAGDEAVSEEVKTAISELKRSENRFLIMIGGLLESYTQDTLPQDNEIVIELK